MHVNKSIVVICTGLYTPGGIERATVSLVNHLSTYGIDVTLLILDKSSESFYAISPQVRVITKDLHFGIIDSGNPVSRKVQFVSHILKLKSLLKKVNAATIITTDYSHTIAAFFAKTKTTKLLSWEHHHFRWIRKNRFWQILFNQVYPKVDTIICLNKTEAKLFHVIGCKTRVIPNFISAKQRTSELERKTLLTIGWLIERKGIDLVPDIAELVSKKYADWKWIIIGKGELYEFLNDALKAKQLENFIEINKPSTPDLDNTYLDTSIYVLPSRFECFPMVLLEAQSFGIPCVAFNCPTGPADIINNGEDGILVKPGDVEEMAAAICSLIADVEKRKKMGEKAHQNVQRFSPENILALWQELINEG